MGSLALQGRSRRNLGSESPVPGRPPVPPILLCCRTGLPQSSRETMRGTNQALGWPRCPHPGAAAKVAGVNRGPQCPAQSGHPGLGIHPWTPTVSVCLMAPPTPLPVYLFHLKSPFHKTVHQFPIDRPVTKFIMKITGRKTTHFKMQLTTAKSTYYSDLHLTEG